MILIPVFHQMTLEPAYTVNSMYQTFFFSVSEDLKVEIN